MFQNNDWNLIKLFNTALIWASYFGHNEIVEILLEQNGIDINTKNIYLLSSMFYSIIR